MTRNLLSALALLFVSCGDAAAPEVEVPAWAKVADEQVAEAKKHGVPVAMAVPSIEVGGRS